MEIKAKGYFSIRLVGMFILFLAFIIQFIVDIILITGILAKILLIIIISPWLVVYLALKLEISSISNNEALSLILSLIYTFIMLFAILFNKIGINQVFFINFQIIFLILILTCWNFSLSIYRGRKIVFFISGISSILFNWVSIFFYSISILWITLSFNSFFILIALILIFSMENIMKKKGLLVYL